MDWKLQETTSPFNTGIVRERARRLEIALMVLPFEEEEKEEYVPIYTHDEDVDANNLPGVQRQLDDYRKLAGSLTQPTAVEESKQEEEGLGAAAPSNNMETMETILRMMVKNDAARVKGKAI